MFEDWYINSKQLKQAMDKQNVSGKIFRLGDDEFLIVYQPYDVLDIDNVENITYSKSYFSKDKHFRKAINEADKEIIKQKGKRS